MNEQMKIIEGNLTKEKDLDKYDDELAKKENEFAEEKEKVEAELGKKIKTLEDKQKELEKNLSKEEKIQKFEEELSEKAKKLEEEKINSEKILEEKLLALEEKQKELDEVIKKGKELSKLEEELKRKAEEFESKQATSSETLKSQMEILAKKEKELAKREAEIEKEKSFSEQLLRQEIETIEKREKDLENEKQKLSDEKVNAKDKFNKEQINLNHKKNELDSKLKDIDMERDEIQMNDLPEIDPTIDQITKDELLASDIFSPRMIHVDEKEVNKSKHDSKKIWLLPDFVIERDHTKNFHHHVHEFIAVVFVNLSRCTSEKAVEFKEYMTGIEKLDSKKIIVDLSFAEFIDSTFLGVLVSFLKKLRRDDRELSVVLDMSKMTSTTFLLSGLDRVFNLAQDLETAFDEFFNS